MNLLDLQTRLRASGRYTGAVDGLYGPMTQQAVLKSLTDGPDTKLTDADYVASAQRLGLMPAHIKAFWTVESSGQAFEEGRPTLLFEPHRFSRATQHAFDASHPQVSYPTWDPHRYPTTQSGRYAQLVEAVGLNVDAGFASASYGGPQILGENFKACGFPASFDFAEAMAVDEVQQLRAFEGFITTTGIVPKLKAKNWAGAALLYNGSSYRENSYDTKLAAAYKAAGGR